MLSITSLATTAALATVENKIPNISDLGKRVDYDAKIECIKNERFLTCDYNKFTNNILDAKETAKNSVNKSGLNKKIKTLAPKEEIKKSATKAEIKAEQDKKVKL